jgi:hypothetical protein
MRPQLSREDTDHPTTRQWQVTRRYLRGDEVIEYLLLKRFLKDKSKSNMENGPPRYIATTPLAWTVDLIIMLRGNPPDFPSKKNP